MASKKAKVAAVVEEPAVEAGVVVDVSAEFVDEAPTEVEEGYTPDPDEDAGEDSGSDEESTDEDFSDDDVPFENASELELIKPAVKSEVRERVRSLIGSLTKTYFQLAKDLHEVRQNSYYVAWGFRTWKEYAETEITIGVRKADYLVQIYDWFGAMGADAQEWVEGLGWTKAKLLVGVVDEKNIDEWKGRTQGLSYAQMVDELNNHGSAEPGGEDTGGGKSSSKSDSGERTAKVSFALFPAQKENVEKALASAKHALKSDKDGHALDLICSDYLASTAGVTSIGDYLKRIESLTGFRLIAFDEQENAFVYGSEVIDEINKKLADEEGDEPAESFGGDADESDSELPE